MNRIHVLDKAVAELIAAGEVVERPASIVKELVENAVDAGATSVTVEIQGGGIAMIRVADNGSGILREDIPKAFIRHATSKVREAEDLYAIGTLGFRGEALASIAAMCRVEVTTRTDGESEGTVYRVEGGEYVDSGPAGCPVGTTVVVRDVFFNTPARMKFLKRDTSEGNAVAQVLDKCALSHPEVAFRFVRDGAVKLRTSGSGELLPVIRAIYGRETAEETLGVDYSLNGIRVRGYLSRPSGAKPSRIYQNFFINGRYVRTRTCSAALEEAFKNKIMAGKYPACVLNLELDAGIVDVNVHPAKIEVRFSDEKPVFHAVYFAVKTSLAQEEQPIVPPREERPGRVTPLTLDLPEQEFPQQRLTAQQFRALMEEQEQEEKMSFQHPLTLSASRASSMEDAPRPLSTGGGRASLDIFVTEPERVAYKPLRRKTEGGPPSPQGGGVQVVGGPDQPQTGEEPLPQEPPRDYRLVGELFGTYILLETEDSALLVDKHAAHERLIYEQLKENIAYGNRQVLLSAVPVSLSREDYGAALEQGERLREMGFLVEDFGGSTVVVREVPVELGERDIPGLVAEIITRIRENHRDLTPEALDRLYYSIACKSAIRAGDKNHPAELEELVRRLSLNPQITHCPHGRPVSVRLGKRDVEKMFGRLG